ncbi:MAG: M20/M25/M40 family metallo-hydrolase [Gemmatimonadales bacterium]|nr:M20/M25/M40 family metallo-hydrolase [Gemmatimonadales bacterium]
MKLRHAFLVAGIALASVVTSLPAQVVAERVDFSVAQRIKDEEMKRSKLDEMASYLTDVIGARLTNSPGSRKANAWAAETFTSWGLANVKVEPWDSAFARGWEIVSYSGRILEPWSKPLAAYPQAWSGGTLDAKGKPATLACPVMIFDVKDTTDFAKYAGKLKGACILRNAPADRGPEFMQSERRFSLDQLLNGDPGSPSIISTVPGLAPPPPTPRGGRGGFGAARAFNAAVGRFLNAEKPALVLQGSQWSYGMYLNGGHFDGRSARDSVYNPIPHLIVATEQYGTLYRIAQRGLPTRIEVNLQVRFLDDTKVPTNVTAEIRGTDKADEVVMIGAHYDSWHSGTGATDNGAGSVVMMEAMRLLKTLNLPMRRTVRIGLWTGEEQGLLGSEAWLRLHKAELPKISAYLNVDNGTGKLRGIWNQDNTAASPIFEQILAPFRDMGVVVVKNGTTGGTDHLSFVDVGVPGFNYIQDPIEYGTRTHHSNLDTYERLVIEDLKQAAAVVAFTVYSIANRDELMPRPPAAAPARPVP